MAGADSISPYRVVPASGVCPAFRRAVPSSHSSRGLSSASWTQNATLDTSQKHMCLFMLKLKGNPRGKEERKKALSRFTRERDSRAILSPQLLCKRERF